MEPGMASYPRPPVLSLVVAVLLGLTACGETQGDPVHMAVTAYEGAIEPVLLEQENISKLFVAITLDKMDPDQAIAQIKGQAVPQSRALLERLQGFQISEPTVQALHQTLIEAASLRVEGYQAMVEGYETKNMDLFFEGREKVTKSKILEETYVGKLDQLASSYGVRIDFFAVPANTQ